MAPFQRLIGPLFADGINSPRIAHHGKDLPLSRVVSRTMHPDEGFHDHAGTVMVIAWGQFMDHDYTLTATPLDPVNRNDPEECCKRPPHLKHPYCNEIRIPDDDYFYRLFGVKCIDFVRGFPSPRPGCRLGSRVPFNTLTGTIDGNTVYGVTEKFARKLRTGFGGLLRMNPVFKEYGLKDLLPLKLDIPDEGCTRPNKNMYCFEAGEIRVNEQLVLTVMHTLMAREHNRIANGLAEVNPHWDDETLFQEARRINIAEIQHITYNEFLPILLGKDVMEKFGLVVEKEGYWDGYDPEVNPDVIASFASAAYRFGHSLLPTAVERWSKAHKFIASKRLSDLIRRPYDLYRAGVLDEYVMGLMNQVAQAMDDSITQEVTNHLFKKVGARFGMDLVSFNMQRGREFGIPGYMEFRKFCGLPPADTFQDLFGSMPNATVQKYETIFDHPIDVDLWSGGVSERPLPGSMLGPTFACIIATQFSYSRRGDRFWYELPNQPSSFTPEQLKEIRKARMARIICDNTDIIDTVQLYPMVLPDHELNPRVPCRSGIIPMMDFSKWAEPAPSPFHGAAKQFMTNATTFENNSTSYEQIKTERCNSTANSTDNEIKNCALITLQAHSNHCSNNNSTNTTDCESTRITLPQNTSNETQIVDNDTVLKYVYKKGDKAEIPIKDKAYFKNSLRRKRSPVEVHNRSPLPSKFQKPVVVNYETSHGPGEATPLAPVKFTGNNALGANFKIETLHDNIDEKKEQDIARKLKIDSAEIENPNGLGNDYKQNNDKSKAIENDSSDDSSNERGDYKNRQSQNDNVSSEERDDYQNPQKIQQSAESDEYKEPKTDSERTYSAERTNYDKKSSRESDNSSENENYKNKQSSQEIDSSGERGSYKDNQSSQEKGESNERGQYRNNEYSNQRGDSAEDNSSSESSESNPRANERYSSRSQNSNQNSESNESSNSEPSSAESQENVERGVSNKKENEHYKQDSSSYEENAKYQKLETRPPKHLESSSSESNDESSESKETSQDEQNLNDHKKGDLKGSPIPLRDIDLSDFSYERIQVDNNGKVQPQKDTFEQVDPKTAVEILPLTTAAPIIDSKNPKSLNSITDYTAIAKPDIGKNDNKLIQIDDVEVKPVVEINPENDNDSSEENKKPNVSEEVESLESILGVKEPENDGSQNDKIIDPKVVQDGDVKQEFERIPLNYNHAEKNENKEHQAPESPKEDPELQQKEGTLDAFAPEDIKYDEHLNIKFDDLAIKLPEIKLPDDILAYSRQDSPYSDDDYKKRTQADVPSYKPSYYYNQNDKEETHERKDEREHRNSNGDSDNDDDHAPDTGYYGYYDNSKKKQNYKNKNADEEEEEESEDNEDLYEKFVRERFGKQGTFQKRSEKLQQAAPLNPDLYKTIKQILKKTADIDEQAKKSGDPNAGYMWTLEYGEKL
ncbi:hypothetical protein HF086_003528 [Spodoptera exigua]|uniref:Chorion peroxidase n=1 Tax=Spodoptera exigua TaxID=7107 RepID=A0A922M945_SPOEX|nr:hypothetical protein HF086_003528 [Spodoptera exigua]